MNDNNLKNFVPGYDPRRNISGRPKKYITTLKDNGYTNAEICDTIKVLISLTSSEIDDIIETESGTMLELTICKALKKGADNGNLYALETILSRVFGKPISKQNDNRNAPTMNKVIYLLDETELPTHDYDPENDTLVRLVNDPTPIPKNI